MTASIPTAFTFTFIKVVISNSFPDMAGLMMTIVLLILSFTRTNTIDTFLLTYLYMLTIFVLQPIIYFNSSVIHIFTSMILSMNSTVCREFRTIE